MMICPQCQQSAGTSDVCPFCGLELRRVRERLKALYAVSTGLFISVLVYAGIVYLFETGQIARPKTVSVHALPYILLVLAVLLFGLALKLGQRLAETTTLAALQRLFVIRVALIDAIAIWGLATYVIVGGVQWFVTFLALSLLGFAQVAAQMPAVAEQVMRLVVLEAQQQADAQRFAPPREREP